MGFGLDVSGASFHVELFPTVHHVCPSCISHWCIWMKYMCYLCFTLIWQLLKRETWIVQAIFLLEYQSSSSLHKLNLACRVKSWDIINVVQTSESLVTESKWFAWLVSSSEVLCITNNLIFYSFCSVLCCIYFVHISLSKTKRHIEVMEKNPMDGADSGAWDWLLSVCLCFPQSYSGLHQPAQRICHCQRLSSRTYDSSVDVITLKLINLWNYFIICI